MRRERGGSAKVLGEQQEPFLLLKHPAHGSFLLGDRDGTGGDEGAHGLECAVQ
jgi:hypothetical protein